MQNNFIIFAFLLLSGTAFSQVTVQAKHYAVTYNPGSIALSFDQNVSLKAFSADRLTEKNVLFDTIIS